MLRCSAVYLTGTYGATGGARAFALPLPYYIRIVVNVKSLFRNFVNFSLAYFAYLRYTMFKGGVTYDNRG